MTEGQKFSRQHSISFVNNNEILIYDNGNERKQTRIIKISLDEENKKVKNYESYNLDKYADAMGSVQEVDDTKGDYLICYGRVKRIRGSNRRKKYYNK